MRGSNWTLGFALECLLDGSAVARSCSDGCVSLGGGACVGLSRWVAYAVLGAAGSSPPGVFGVKPFLWKAFWLCALAVGLCRVVLLPGAFLGGGAGLLEGCPGGGFLSLIRSHASYVLRRASAPS
jgi:hypothetical protein